MDKFNISMTPFEAEKILAEHMYTEGISTTLIEKYSTTAPNGREVVMLVYEKYYMRTSSRASLSVIIENTNGDTVVCAIGSGGGTGSIFKFDWGAGSSFAHSVLDAFKDYKL